MDILSFFGGSLAAMAESFRAFNMNAWAHLTYVLSTNAWFLLVLAGLVGNVVMNLMAEVDASYDNTREII